MTDETAELLGLMIDELRRVQPAAATALMEVHEPAMTAPGYKLELWPYAYGQWRIMLLRTDRGYIDVVRQMCTYDREKALGMMVELMRQEDPEAHCRSLERPWNCEVPGRGRIRLDNTPEDRKYDRRDG